MTFVEFQVQFGFLMLLDIINLPMIEINDATNIKDKYKEENGDDNYEMWRNKVISLIRNAKRPLYYSY